MSETEYEKRTHENSDGTVIVDLVEPIRVGKEEHHRVTLGRLTVGVARRFYTVGEESDEGKAALRGLQDGLDIANAISTPTNAADLALTEADMLALARAGQLQLGKFRGTAENGSA